MNTTLKRLVTSLSVIIVAAFLVRLGFALLGLVGRPIPEEFSWETGRIARSIALGKGFGNPYPGVETGPTALMPPLYPFLLGGIFKLFGVYSYASYFIAVLLNELFSVLTCLPIYFIGKRIGGLSVAAGSAWLWAVFPAAVIVPTEFIWDNTMIAFVLVSIVWATLEISESVAVWHWTVYGLLWGIGLALNPSILSTMPFMMLWLAFRLRKRGERWLRLPAIALSVMFLCCVPWTARNHVIFHHVIPFRSNFGLELWLGNHSLDQRVLPEVESPYYNLPLHREYVAKGEIAFMEAKKAEALDYIAASPGTFVRFTCFRFVETWLGAPSEPVTDILKNYSWNVVILLVLLLLLVNVVVVVYGLSGLLILWRKQRRIFVPIAIVPLVYPMIYYVTHPSLRFRHPIDPVLIIMATYAACHGTPAVTRRSVVAITDSKVVADVLESR
jgi:4-amino-4-deoxy-L-arabinose transferase-like glycosyltransferase